MGWFIPWPWVAGTAANFGGDLAMEMGDCGTEAKFKLRVW